MKHSHLRITRTRIVIKQSGHKKLTTYSSILHCIRTLYVFNIFIFLLFDFFQVNIRRQRNLHPMSVIFEFRDAFCFFLESFDVVDGEDDHRDLVQHGPAANVRNIPLILVGFLSRFRHTTRGVIQSAVKLCLSDDVLLHSVIQLHPTVLQIPIEFAARCQKNNRSASNHLQYHNHNIQNQCNLVLIASASASQQCSDEQRATQCHDGLPPHTPQPFAKFTLRFVDAGGSQRHATSDQQRIRQKDKLSAKRVLKSNR
mmetsp:Transcript_29565/g.48160  ORF Transcript_29565/g.48160 Transcript_29565/m.48160 type:complete len:256 (-) Transcript_29565:137-904(-)